MLGSAGSSLLENSMEESSLSLEDSQVNSAEMTLAVFFLHLVGSGVRPHLRTWQSPQRLIMSSGQSGLSGLSSPVMREIVASISF